MESRFGQGPSVVVVVVVGCGGGGGDGGCGGGGGLLGHADVIAIIVSKHSTSFIIFTASLSGG